MRAVGLDLAQRETGMLLCKRAEGSHEASPGQRTLFFCGSRLRTCDRGTIVLRIGFLRRLECLIEKGSRQRAAQQSCRQPEVKRTGKSFRFDEKLHIT